MKHFATRGRKNPWTPPLISREQFFGHPRKLMTKNRGTPLKFREISAFHE
tara:strand:+ start:245 stop:394 length:150 start_codon:yes stop_codon:yes gene_type:complete